MLHWIDVEFLTGQSGWHLFPARYRYEWSHSLSRCIWQHRFSPGLRMAEILLVAELKRLFWKYAFFFWSKFIFKYNENCAAFIMNVEIMLASKERESEGRERWFDSANSHVKKINRVCCSKDSQKVGWNVQNASSAYFFLKMLFIYFFLENISLVVF